MNLNNKGFTLIEGLIAAAITMIIVVGVMSTITLFSLNNQRNFVIYCLVDANNYAVGLCKAHVLDNTVDISNINNYQCGGLNITNSINPGGCTVNQNTCQDITFISSYRIFKLSQTVRICN
jgi:type II secretory pathway pseudopilin PulG